MDDARCGRAAALWGEVRLRFTAVPIQLLERAGVWSRSQLYALSSASLDSGKMPYLPGASADLQLSAEDT
jgi:hypothetical protein